MAELKKFEGREVVAVGVEMPNAAGGLQPALDIDPEEWHHGDIVHLVMKCSVSKVRFQPVKKDADDLQRVHVLHVTEASLIDPDLVTEVLTETQERIRKAEEEASGQKSLLDGDQEPVGPDPDEDEDAPPGADDDDEVVPEDDEVQAADVPPYNTWKKTELVEEIQNRNIVQERTAETMLSTQGSKDQLIARLEADDAGPAPSPAE